VLKWHTPLDGFSADMFRVELDGRAVPYIGALVKRGAPTAEDFVTIEPQGSVTATLNLAAGYAIYQAGRYSVELRARTLALAGGANVAGAKSLALVSNRVTVEVAQNRPQPPQPAVRALKGATAEDVKAKPAAKAASFKGCTDARKTDLEAAHSKATDL